METYSSGTLPTLDQSKKLSDEPCQGVNSPQPQLPCYCTALMVRARFMNNGWKQVPCDGTFCARHRQKHEETDR